MLAGEDGRVLGRARAQVERELRTIPGIGNVTSTASLVRPELVVRPDFARAADLGVTSAAIADTLRVATAGDYDQGLRQAEPVAAPGADRREAARAGARSDLELLERLAVPGARGPVMLGNVATLAIDSGPAEIDRYDRLRNVNFEIELNRPAAGRRRAAGAGAAQPAATCRPASMRSDGRRRRGDGRAVRELRPGDADRRAVHLHRAGAAVQGLRAAGDDPRGAAAVDSAAPSSALFITQTRCRCRR